ncbi:hypothetical protein Tco_1210210 [Tanacetum coccineum]
MRSHQNESLAIAERNLLDDEASSSNNTRAKLPTPPKTLHEHSRLNSFGFQNPITFPTKQTRRIIDSRDIWFIQSTYTFQGLRNEDPLHHVKHYLRIVDNIQADRATRDTSRGKPKKKGLRAQNQALYKNLHSFNHAILSTFQDIQSTFSFQIKEAEKDDEDERLLSIFKQIHINLPFLEAMIHMPKGAKVLKDLLLHKEKLKKTASSVKLSEECSAIIQRSLPKRKETQEVSHCHASSDPWQ